MKILKNTENCELWPCHFSISNQEISQHTKLCDIKQQNNAIMHILKVLVSQRYFPQVQTLQGFDRAAGCQGVKVQANSKPSVHVTTVAMLLFIFIRNMHNV